MNPSRSHALFACVPLLVTACGELAVAERSDAVATCGVVAPQASFRCTEIIGFSQTHNWWGAGAPSWFETSPGIDGARWQLRWRNGATIERWADPAYEGWNLAAPGTHLESRCTEATVERVVLTIGSESLDGGSPAADWAAGISAAVAEIRNHHPAAAVVLQPIVGGVPGAPCETRASTSHPVIVEAVGLVADSVDTFAGPDVEVARCVAFADALGHLTPEGGRRIGAQVASCYAR